jgi:hypothetical protein
MSLFRITGQSEQSYLPRISVVRTALALTPFPLRGGKEPARVREGLYGDLCASATALRER